jgi:3-dehydroquinate synthase
MQLQVVGVHLGQKSYPILIGSGILPQVGKEVETILGIRRAVVLTVARVRRLYGHSLEASLAAGGIESSTIEVPDREEGKTLETYSKVMKELLAIGAGKDTVIVALGGGCAGDLAGFVASTYMRGVGLVQVPTTLLAQVDSSIGGKTALNLPDAKNIIGTFYQPSLVYSDVDVLKTLPSRELRCGVAELIKYGAIMDLGLLDFLERERDALMHLKQPVVMEAVVSAARLKVKIVMEDETESMGLRTILNFGHTIGHAVEAATGYEGCSHGEAVAVGMLGEARLAVSLGLCTKGEVERLERIISSYGLPTRIRGINPATVIELMGHDKKISVGKWRFALPRGLGKSIVVSGLPMEGIFDAVQGVVGD